MNAAVDSEFDLYRRWCDRFLDAVSGQLEAHRTESGILVVPWERDGRTYAATFSRGGVRVYHFGEDGTTEGITRLGGEWIVPLVRFYNTGEYGEGGCLVPAEEEQT